MMANPAPPHQKYDKNDKIKIEYRPMELNPETGRPRPANASRSGQVASARTIWPHSATTGQLPTAPPRKLITYLPTYLVCVMPGATEGFCGTEGIFFTLSTRGFLPLFSKEMLQCPAQHHGIKFETNLVTCILGNWNEDRK